MNEQAIHIQNLNIGYQKGKISNSIASGLNGSVQYGELNCLLGANGAGKSTLLQTLCGFLPAISGSVTIMENPIKKLNEKKLSRLISVVLTDKIQLENATVEELVSYGRSPYTNLFGRSQKKDWKVVNQALESCGIDHKRKSLISTLSDGERQKAFIAKALAQDTPLILLDEPTAFLDLPARVDIIHLLRKIASSSNKAILMSTHDLHLAIQMADKLWLLPQGGPLISGSPEDLQISNSFQSIFNNPNIEFDNHTGLFKVEYQHKQELPVKGHGFEYTLLRRAFARKGIKLINHDHSSNIWIKIEKNEETPFSLIHHDHIIANEKSVQKIVDRTLEKMN